MVVLTYRGHSLTPYSIKWQPWKRATSCALEWHVVGIWADVDTKAECYPISSLTPLR